LREYSNVSRGFRCWPARWYKRYLSFPLPSGGRSPLNNGNESFCHLACQHLKPQEVEYTFKMLAMRQLGGGHKPYSPRSPHHNIHPRRRRPATTRHPPALCSSKALAPEVLVHLRGQRLAGVARDTAVWRGGTSRLFAGLQRPPRQSNFARVCGLLGLIFVSFCREAY
jgi:hypothetical protein